MRPLINKKLSIKKLHYLVNFVVTKTNIMLNNIWLLGGHDLFSEFGIVIKRNALDGFLQIPDTKDRTSEDYEDQNGTDYDYQEPYAKERDVTVSMAMRANNPDDYYQKITAFRNLLFSSGLLIFQVAYHNRGYYVLYKSTSNIVKYMSLNGGLITFDITFTEPNPLHIYNPSLATAWVADTNDQIIDNQLTNFIFNEQENN